MLVSGVVVDHDVQPHSRVGLGHQLQEGDRQLVPSVRDGRSTDGPRDGRPVTSTSLRCVVSRVLYVEAKGRTGPNAGTDVDTAYGQHLGRMRQADEIPAEFAMVVPDSAVWHALGVSQRVRDALRIDVYCVIEDGAVSFVGDGTDPVIVTDPTA
jgi:hypothetical protein